VQAQLNSSNSCIVNVNKAAAQRSITSRFIRSKIMRRYTIKQLTSGRIRAQFVFCAVLALCNSVVLQSARAAVTWDSQGVNPDTSNPTGSATQWWFDPANWSDETPASMAAAAPYYLPPNNSSGAVTDTQINVGTATLPGGEGVVYDPSNDPNFANIGANPGNYPFPAGFGPQVIQNISLGRAQLVAGPGATNVPAPQAPNVLTVKGNLDFTLEVILGRSSTEAGKPGDGRINQLSGTVKVNSANLDIASTDTSTNSGQVTTYGNGVYDYRGGTLEVQLSNQNGGIRLSPSGSVGAAGIGRFIDRNPGTAGYIRTYDFNVAAGAGVAARLANGTTLGVGIAEFHSAGASGTRPIQVGRNLIINNGLVSTGTGAGGIRSSRLQLVLDSAPTVDGNGVPQNLGLFDTDFDQTDIDPVSQAPIIGNDTTGTGDLGDFFSNIDASAVYGQNSIVSATFNGSTYNWKISYTGNITWADPNASTVASITGTGGADVVLIGDSSVIVPQGTPGDFNNDGKVDAADYPIWRKNSANGSLPHDNGLTTQADRYTLWRANFGKPPGAGSGLGASSVPEPSSIALLMLGVVAAALARRQR
jgi:hypothetical protein